MAFNPNPGDQLQINGITYKVGTHPAAPGMAYAQAGRQGVVYQLIPESGAASQTMALKIFLPRFRIPSHVHLSQTMENFSQIQGLQVCKREVLTPERNGALIAEYPELLYAVLMPWIHGWTWMDVLGGGEPLSSAASLEAALALAKVGSAMEQRGIAHCDLSAPNVMFTGSKQTDIELVDVEQMFSPRLDPPDLLLGGSPGYASLRKEGGELAQHWNAYADRFPGAVMIAEMLGWCDPVIRSQAWGESYFDPAEMQKPTERYLLLIRTLEASWGKETAELFARAWSSGDARSCPAFGEWLIALTRAETRLKVAKPSEAIQPGTAVEGNQTGSPPAALVTEVEETQTSGLLFSTTAARYGAEREALIAVERARDLENRGETHEAREQYLWALKAAVPGSPLYVEIFTAVQELKSREQALHSELDHSGPMDNAADGVMELKRKDQSSTKVGTKIFISGKSGGSRFTRKRIWTGSGIAALVIAAVVGTLLLGNHSNGSGNPLAFPPPSAEPSPSPVSSLSAAPDASDLDEAKQAEAERIAREEEEKRLAAEKAEQERAEQEKQQQAAIKAALQKKYDQQEAYNKYLAWKKNKEIEQEQEKAAAEKAARLEAERKAAKQAAEEAERKRREAERAKQEQQIKAARDQKTVKMIAYYNSAYNAQKSGHRDMAEKYCRSFLEIYDTDAAYFVKTGTIGKRVGHVYKYLQSSTYELPDL